MPRRASRPIIALGVALVAAAEQEVRQHPDGSFDPAKVDEILVERTRPTVVDPAAIGYS